MIRDLWRRIHRENALWYDTLPVLYLITYGMYIIGSYIGSVVIWLLSGRFEPDFFYTLSLYVWFIGVWIAYLLLFLIKPYRSMYGFIGRGLKGNTLRNLLLGFGIGFLMNAACITAALLNGDIHLSFNRVRPVELFILLVAALIQGFGEELMDRGFIYQRAGLCYRHPLVPILGNSLFFSLLHLMNPGVSLMAIIHITLVGFFFSLMVYYFESLWMAMAAHSAWNYCQNMIFGLPNSGLVSRVSVFKLDAASARSSMAYNVEFGVEGTFVSIAVTLVGIAGLVIVGRKLRSTQETITKEI